MELLGIGMMMGSIITLLSIYLTMRHMMKEEERRGLLDGHYDVEIKNKNNYIKTDVVLKKRGNFYVRG
tara:strand:+ start:49 stop:252 length:204 start_codon:yes stop_codon:yes gene_type:complete